MARLTIERTDGIEIVECVTVGQWMDDQGWPPLVLCAPDGRKLTEDDAEALLDPAAELLAHERHGEIATIVYAVIAVIAAAYSIYVANSIKIPEQQPNRNASTGNNELTGRTNKPAQIGQRIPDIWGVEPRAYPLLLSSYRRFDSTGQESEWSYLLLGRGNHHIEDVRDGDTPAVNIAGTTIQIYGPNKSPYSTAYQAPDILIGNEVDRSLAPKIMIQSNEVDGIVVAAPNAQETGATLLIMPDGWLELTDAASGQTLADLLGVGDPVTLRDCFGWEFVSEPYAPPWSGNYLYYRRHDLEGSYTVVNKDATRVQVTPGAQPGWAYIPVGGQYQALSARVGNPLGPTGPSSGLVGYDPSFPDGSYPSTNIAFTLRTDIYAPGGWSAGTNTIGPFTVTNCNGMILNFTARGGLYREPASGDPELTSVEFEILIERAGFAPETYTHTIRTNEINRKDATGSTFTYDVYPQGGDMQVTVTRLTPTDKTFAGAVVDEVQLRDLYAVREMPLEWQYGTYPGNVTTILAVTRANSEASRVKERKLNMRATRRLSASATNDALFKNILPAMHVDAFNGRRTIDTIDTTALALLDAEIVAAGTAGDYPDDGHRICGYTFDDDQKTYADQLRLLCRAVNLRPFHIGGEISFLWDFKRDPDILITHRDIEPGTFTIQRNFTPSREFSGVELSYKNYERGDQNTITVDASGAEEKIELLGQHYPEMAEYAANSARARQKYQRLAVEFGCGLIAQRLAVGMRALVEDCTRKTTAGGEIVAVAGGVLTTSQPVPNGIDSVWLAKRNGEAYSVAATKTGANQITLGGGVVLPEPIYTDWQERRTRYAVWGSAAKAKPLDLLITEIDIKSGSTATISAVNYDDRYYAWPT